MTETEKAKELVEKYSPLVTTWDCYYDTPVSPHLILADAKKCALICVDEIIDFLANCANIDIEHDDYWIEVKEEINAL